LPLDGGNILKAAVWKLTGNPYKGVTFAGRVGQVFGWVAIASGLFPLLAFGSFANFWNLLVGGFLLQNAGRAAQCARVQDRLSGLTAADAVLPDSPVVSDQLSLREFADQRILSPKPWRKFLVTDAAGQLLGTVSVDALTTIPNAKWAETSVRDLVQSIESTTIVQSDRPLLEAVSLLEQNKLTALTVVRGNNILVGLLEKASVIDLLQDRMQANPA
jgi:CBS-domain-containing membrane protein